MPRTLSDWDKIKSYFLRTPPNELPVVVERINLILEARGCDARVQSEPPPRRGRPRKRNQEPLLGERLEDAQGTSS